MDRWTRKAFFELLISLVALGPVLALYARFVGWVEHRAGVVLPDPLLRLWAPRDLTWVSFFVIYAALLASAASLVRHPSRLCLTLQSYLVMVLLRIAAMWLMPLEPPPDTLPLVDPFVRSLGPSEILTKDLFFSGHTATLVLLYWVTPRGWLKSLLLLGTVVVAGAVLIQHVHYGIDVLAAPLFTLGALAIVVRVRERLGLRDMEPLQPGIDPHWLTGAR